MAPLLTDRELDIMDVLWRFGSATAGEVRAELKDPLAYNTVLTILGILEEKGHVRHEAEGRAFRYHPLLARQDAKAGAARRLVDRLFEGEPRLLATHLMNERSLTTEDLQELRALLDRRLRGNKPAASSSRKKP